MGGVSTFPTLAICALVQRCANNRYQYFIFHRSYILREVWKRWRRLAGGTGFAAAWRRNEDANLVSPKGVAL